LREFLTRKKDIFRLIPIALLAACMAGFPLLLAGAGPAGAEEAAPVKRFHLYATDGYLTLPDGKQVYIWGFSLQNAQGTAVYPAPKLEVTEGDTVEVVLTNIGPKKEGIRRLAHTIHFHGLDTDQANDGVPHTSVPIQVGESFTYRFTATHAGTYFYHCHVDTVEHLQMGMFGAFIVKAKDGAKAWTGGPAYDKEYTFVLNEIDPVWHEAVEAGESYDRTDFHPRYWTINGKAYPDTEKNPDSMIEGKVGETVLIRLINAGYEPHSFHMHGHHFQVAASDGRPLPEPVEKDTVLLGPGERYDLLVTFTQSGMYPFHSHNIVDNTNDGVYPGGLHTMIDIAPAGGSAAGGTHHHAAGGASAPGPAAASAAASAPAAAAAKTITLKAGEPAAVVNGEQVPLNPPPAAVSGTTFVPLRFIGEQMSAGVEWMAEERSVVYTTRNARIQLWVDRAEVLVNGKEARLNQPPRIIGGATMVPLRFVSENLGASVDYDAATGEITIRYGGGENVSGGNAEPAGASPVDANEVTVLIQNSAYSAKELRIRKGTTVTWINKDGMIHTVTDLGNRFDSGSMPAGGTWSYTFGETGTFTYYCTTHPGMIAKVIVVENE